MGFLVSALWKVIGLGSSLQFVLSASGDPHMVVIWNFLTSPTGNLAVLGYGIAWIGIVCVKEIKHVPKAAPSEQKSDSLGALVIDPLFEIVRASAIITEQRLAGSDSMTVIAVTHRVLKWAEEPDRLKAEASRETRSPRG